MISRTNSRLHVAVVGGGISGVCTAIGLLKYPHIDVQIYEAANEFSEIGAGLLLGPNAVRALKEISNDTYEAYIRLQTGNLHPKHKNTFYELIYATGPRAGQKICSIKNEIGQSSIHRAKFLNSLVQQIPKEICNMGRRLESLQQDDEGVTLRFADGSVAYADCVVGADGVHSPTRKAVFPDRWKDFEPVFTGVVGYRGLLPMDEARRVIGDEWAMNSFNFCGNNCLTASYPIDFGETFNLIATKYHPEKTWEGPWVQTANFEEIKEVFNDWPPETFKLLKALDRPNIMKWSLWKIPAIPHSHSNRIIVIGDAAHASLPTQAAGAGQAIEDAFVISSVLGHIKSPSHIPAAFRGYDKIRLPRAQRSCHTSDEALEVFNLRMEGVGDDPERLRGAIEGRFDWIWNRDVALMGVQARRIVDNILGR